jgi:hypothetical protein
MREWKWSPAEKAVARRAFDMALNGELEAILRETKERAARIRGTSELWGLERWLGERRREIDQKYDYRYSVLPTVFARLVGERRLSIDDLKGLEPEKLAAIRLWTEH